ncbi:hypothetical protein A9G22_09375 [Gilliamella sp. App2-1]|nr:hypothetical protein A9G22_09375 [Gilliamella apicola]OCG22556.1 hypothetical protein A9G23_02670 [Gilliamella apicola]
MFDRKFFVKKNIELMYPFSPKRLKKFKDGMQYHKFTNWAKSDGIAINYITIQIFNIKMVKW